MVYLLVRKNVKLNAEIIEINQESNEVFEIENKKEKGFYAFFFFFYFS